MAYSGTTRTPPAVCNYPALRIGTIKGGLFFFFFWRNKKKHNMMGEHGVAACRRGKKKKMRYDTNKHCMPVGRPAGRLGGRTQPLPASRSAMPL